MAFKDIEKKSLKDLHLLLAEKREEMRELKFQLASNQLKRIRKVRAVKKEIAQILTRINQLSAEERTTDV